MWIKHLGRRIQKEGNSASDVPEYRGPPHQQVFTADKSREQLPKLGRNCVWTVCEPVSPSRGCWCSKIWWGWGSLGPYAPQTNNPNLPKEKPHSEDKMLKGKSKLNKTGTIWTPLIMRSHKSGGGEQRRKIPERERLCSVLLWRSLQSKIGQKN